MMGFLGEHSCYDGTMSALMNFYIMLSILDQPDVNWDEEISAVSAPREIRFVLDDKMLSEITRMQGVFEENVSKF